MYTSHKGGVIATPKGYQYSNYTSSSWTGLLNKFTHNFQGVKQFLQLFRYLFFLLLLNAGWSCQAFFRRHFWKKMWKTFKHAWAMMGTFPFQRQLIRVARPIMKKHPCTHIQCWVLRLWELITETCFVYSDICTSNPPTTFPH